MESSNKDLKVVIIGGLGHVGLPLGIVLADKGLKVDLYDLDKEKGETVKKGEMPFLEYGAEEILKKVMQNKNLNVSNDIECVSEADYIIIAIGTPVDEYLNPKTRAFLDFFNKLKKYLNKDQTIIIRSTVYPRTCQQVQKILGENSPHIAYCPERIVQGYAIQELKELPQVVTGLDEVAIKKATELFELISPKIIETTVGEAELVKLFTNAWRYIQFAVTNQFYMIANNFGVNYDNVRHAMTEGYKRASKLPSAGFAAGPCLLKDTLQLAAFNNNNFFLGHAAMMINEGLPNFVVEKLSEKYDLSKTKVGILGMTYKADIDDIRDALSFKLRKILEFHGAKVYCSDEYFKDSEFVSKEELMNLCDVVIIGVPHKIYKNVPNKNNIEIIDLWNIIQA